MVVGIFKTYPICPEELALLQNVFNQVCVGERCSSNSPEAEDIASLLIWLYQTGMKDELMLMAEVTHRLKPPAKEMIYPRARLH
jgi:hypothetical protein